MNSTHYRSESAQTPSPLNGASSNLLQRMRRPRLVGGLVAIAALFVSVFAMSASADTTDMRILRGSIGDGQSHESLRVMDNSGTQDNWPGYIEFMPDSRRHFSDIWIEPNGSGVDSVTIDLNYRGPDWAVNRWILRIRDNEANRWVPVFTNRNVNPWVWTQSSIELSDAGRFLDSQGRARLRYHSKTDNDVSQLDYLALTLQGTDPGPATTTTLAPTTTERPTTTQPVTTTTEPAPTTTQPATTTTERPTTTQPVTTTTERPTTTQPATTTTQPAPTTTTTTRPSTGFVLPPVNAKFDYQLWAPYPLPSGVSIVARDWYDGSPVSNAYSICYINGFQTQPDSGSTRPDETSNWPSSVVGPWEDPNWAGEYMIDLRTSAQRQTAANWVKSQMIDTCAAKGYDAVEFDNLDSFTRVPGRAFGSDEAYAFAADLVDHVHSRGMAAGQKNSVEMIASGDHRRVGFDFVIAESCGQYYECQGYLDGYDGHAYLIEYNRNVFNRVCDGYGDQVSVILRDLNLTPAGNGSYVYDAC